MSDTDLMRLWVSWQGKGSFDGVYACAWGGRIWQEDELKYRNALGQIIPTRIVRYHHVSDIKSNGREEKWSEEMLASSTASSRMIHEMVRIYHLDKKVTL